MRKGVMAVELTSGDQHPEGDAVPGRHPALLSVAEVLSRRDAGAVLIDAGSPPSSRRAICAGL
jgi:hypothetical protein